MNSLESRKYLNILYLNTYGQTKFTLQKQLQIEAIVKQNNSDIVHLQETDIEESSFQHCDFINSNYCILVNNSLSGYGTACLVHNDFLVENVCYNCRQLKEMY